jgi:soluble lytic murein transglycosylase
MRRSAFWLLLAILLPPLGWAPESAWAAVYRYVDDRGVIHFTNVPRDDRYEWIPVSPTSISLRQRERRDIKLPAQNAYDHVIVRAARNHRVEPALVKAVIAAESNFEAQAVSRVGAQGLMQLMPATSRTLGVRDPFHPTENVEGGTRYLREMLDRYGDLRRALAAYNAGPKAVDRYQGIPPYTETREYVYRVLNYYRGYDDEFRRRSRARTRGAGASKGGRVAGAARGSGGGEGE